MTRPPFEVADIVLAPILVVQPASAAVTHHAGSCRISGDFAVCVASGNATGGIKNIYAHVSASPNQSVDVSWSMVCVKGSGAASKSCCRRCTIISFLAFHTHWCPSFGKTRRSCFLSCSKPRLPRYWRSRPIRSIWAPRLDSSASCIPGDKLCNNIPIFTALCPAAAYHRTTPAGSLLDPTSFCR